MHTVYARVGGVGGSQQREVVDGAGAADVFTDTGIVHVDASINWAGVNVTVAYKCCANHFVLMTVLW